MEGIANFIGKYVFRVFDFDDHHFYQSLFLIFIQTHFGYFTFYVLSHEVYHCPYLLFRWSKDNIPEYYAKVSPFVDPAIETTWTYSVQFANTVYKYSKPAIDFIGKQTEKLFEKVIFTIEGESNQKGN